MGFLVKIIDLVHVNPAGLNLRLSQAMNMKKQAIYSLRTYLKALEYDM
ncbi:hypothetical protein P278_02210 [Zhouia amylolytica AD3]|uniref:Uncharacterized protein n=1 Tax=Zhouia amylolytica AD3 TaxID=1286632 RepID=W2URM6_9FLAO|nr:hypothetical protein P278_02210 [Zhouia amylolytica AD3]